MVLGRAGFRLEAQKFALYLLVPITASLAFNEPAVQKWAADYFQLIKYPSNPHTNLKEEFEALKKQREEDVDRAKLMEEKRANGRIEYMNQLKQLNAARGGSSGDEHNDAEPSGERKWLGWMRGWTHGQTTAPADR